MIPPRIAAAIGSLCLASLFASVANGAILVRYNFETAPNNTPDTASTVEPGVTATTLTATGPGGGAIPTTSTTSNVPSGSRARAITLDNIDNDFATDHYYSFQITPTVVGQALDLTNLTFLFNISANLADQASSYQLSYDDLSDGVGNYIVVGTTATVSNTTALTANFDLSGAAFDNLTAGIRFRLDMKDNGSIASNASLRIDDLTVNGTVIPEPGAVLLSLLGVTGLLVRRRA